MSLSPIKRLELRIKEQRKVFRLINHPENATAVYLLRGELKGLTYALRMLRGVNKKGIVRAKRRTTTRNKE